MAFTKNTIFYKVINDKYKLCFVPADTIDLSSPTEIEFLDNLFLQNSIVIKRNYADELPLGMEETPEIKLSLNLSNFVGDWADVAEWILDIKSVTKSVTLAGGAVTLPLPNRWYIDYDIAGNGTFTKRIFDGVQENAPSYKLTLESASLTRVEITALDILRSAAQNYTRSMIIDAVHTLTSDSLGVKALFRDFYQSDGVTTDVARCWGYSKEPGLTSALVTSLSAKEGVIKADYEVIMQAYTRSASTSVGALDIFLQDGAGGAGIINYTSDGTYDNRRDATLLGNEIFTLDDTGGTDDFVGGLFTDGKGSLKFENLWDLLLLFYSNLPVKSSLSYSFAINSLFVLAGDDSAITLTNVANCELEVGYGVVGSINCGLVDLQAKDRLAPLQELPRYVDGIINQETYETELNLYSEPHGAYGVSWTNPDANVQETDYFNFHNIYYFLSSATGFRVYRRASMFPKMPLGEGVYIEADDTPIPGLPAEVIFEWYIGWCYANKWFLNQNPGTAGVVSGAFKYLLGNKRQALLTCEIPSEQVLPTDLGQTYTIDINSIFDFSAPTFETRAILTSIEQDIESELTKVSLFIVGQ